MPKNQPRRIIDTKKQTVIVRGASGSGSGGGGGGGVTDHGALTGLSDNDHPQYLLSSTAAATYALKAVIVTAGAGMTSTPDPATLAAGFTINVGAGNGIIVSTDTVGVKLPTISGLLVDSSGLAVQLDPVKTGLSLAAGGLGLDVHDIITKHNAATGIAWDVVSKGAGTAVQWRTPLFDVSAGAGVEALLKSNASGYIKLNALDVAGTINVLDGGDFTVASQQYAGPLIFADASQGSVGIQRIPDPQFALDVSGPMRASYFVGPHALQIKDAGLILHFDGWEKGLEGEFTGIPLGQMALPVGPLTFIPGKFGKSLAFGEPSTNYVENPSFEVNAVGWTAGGGQGAGTGRDATYGYVGSCSYKLVASATSSQTSYILNNTITTVPNGGTVWVQCRVWRSSPWGRAGLAVRYNGASQNTVYTANDGSTGGDSWELLYTSWTNTTGSTQTVGIIIANLGGDDTTFTMWIDAIQLEIDHITPYFDGSIAGYNGTTLQSFHVARSPSWVGTAHASASTRPATSRVSYEMSSIGLQAAAGTICFWLKNYSPNITQSGSAFIVEAGAANAELDVAFTGSGAQSLRARINGASLSVTWNTAWNFTWKHVALTWTSTHARMYLDGVLVGSGYVTVSGDENGFPYPVSRTDPLVLHTHFGLGYRATTSYTMNGLIDDVVIVKRRLTGVEVKAIFESEAPVFAESSVFSFRATPTGLVWADEEGLWMKDIVGNTVFGAYGGAAETKTWGGHTLSRGDLLIGNASQYVKWDNDGNSGAGLLTVTGAINIISVTGTVPVGNVGGLGTLATQNNLDGVPDGGTYKRTTANEKTGALRGYNAIGSGNQLVTRVVPADLAAPSASGLYLGSDYMGYYLSGTGWRTYMDKFGNFYLGGTAGALQWDGSTLEITGKITAEEGKIGGWTIGETYLTSGVGAYAVGMGSSATSSAFWAGGTSAGARFRVSFGGAVTATLGNIGAWRVGMWSLETGLTSAQTVGIYSGTADDETNPAHFTAFWAGAALSGRQSAPFRVTNQGHIHGKALIHSFNAGVITAPNANSLALMSYSDGYEGAKNYLTVWQVATTTVGVHIGSNLTNGFQITRAEAANSPVYLKNQGTGNIEFQINSTRSLTLSNTGTFTVYDNQSTPAVVGQIVDTGAFRSNSSLGSVTVGKFLPYTPNAVVASGSIILGSVFGVLIIFASTSGDTAIVILRGGGTTPHIVSQSTAALFTTVAGTPGKTNIYASGGNILLQNGHTSNTYTYHLTLFGSNAA